MDPLKGKNLNVSAYVYCYNNPVKYIDPDGKFSSEFRSNLHRFFHGGNKNSKSYKLENRVWGYNKPYIGNYLTEGGAIFIDGKNRNYSKTGKARESFQEGGYGMFGSSSTQENNLPKAKHYYGTLDIKGLLFPFANPSLPSFELFDLAKMVAFTTDYIDSSNKGAGVELNNAPEIEEPYPIVISYSDKWLKNISGFKSNTVYDTVYNKEQYDSVINIANSTKLQDTGIYEKRLSETYFEPTK